MTSIAFVDNYIPLRTLLSAHLSNLPYNYTVYQYENGLDFTNRFPTQNYTPAVVLMDIRMPEMNGYETTRWLKKNYPNIPVLVFSDIENVEVIVALVRCGANGYTSKQKSSNLVHLQNVMTQIINGKEYYDDPNMYAFIKERLTMSKKDIKKGVESLSEKEMAVLRYLAHNKSIEDKAISLCISPHTYNNHLKKIFNKLGVNSSNSLYKYAVMLGFIEL